MIEQDIDQFLQAVMFQSSGNQVEVNAYQFVSGGCINVAMKVETSIGDFFLKWNETQPSEFFEKEANGLDLLQSTGVVATPYVISTGQAWGRSYLLLEHLPMQNPIPDYWQHLGHNLAALHKTTKQKFGLNENNYFGSLPQKNAPLSNWVDFYIENRLEVQLGLAIYNNRIESSFARKFRRIYAVLPGEMPEEPPALLHGDLWSGNVLVGKEGKPYLIDPAVYYGHREMDLAFSMLFGGFGNEFFSTYNETNPLAPGFQNRVGLYQLYPLLVHLNLFGTSYLSGIERIMNRFC